MNKEKRQASILEHIVFNQEATIQELAEKFDVHEMTIRRDLITLEENNPIMRTHGGVIVKLYERDRFLYKFRLVSQLEEKQAIAKKALDYIDNGDTLILDAGSTTLELAKLLYLRQNLTVITNDFFIKNELENNAQIQVIFAGGTIAEGFEYMASGITNKQFYSHIHVSKAFMGMNSVDFKYGLSHIDLDVALSKQGMIDSADNIFLLVDSSKFNKTALHKIHDIDVVNTIITNSEFDEAKYDIPESIDLIIS